MKINIILIVLGLTLATSLHALSVSEYEQLKKDVTVMSQIIDSTFNDGGECENCYIKIEGKYLAGQGIVFLVNRRDQGFYFLDDGDSHAFAVALGDPEETEFFPTMVEDMIEGVVAGVAPMPPSDPGMNWEMMIEISDGASREAIRELRRERRELEQEIRENEIQIIHMDEADAKPMEASIREMEEQVRKLLEKQMQIEEKVNLSREEYRKAREERRQQKETQRQQRNALVQNKVLEAFCDYGSTLRSLPAKEKITLIFENTHRKPRQDTVLVFQQKDITNCNRDESKLLQQALSYQF